MEENDLVKIKCRCGESLSNTLVPNDIELKVHVAYPANIEAYSKQASNGSFYVEFDVSSSTLTQGGAQGWGIINGPGSLLDRLYAQKGMPRIAEAPQATDIRIEGSKYV